MDAIYFILLYQYNQVNRCSFYLKVVASILGFSFNYLLIFMIKWV